MMTAQARPYPGWSPRMRGVLAGRIGKTLLVLAALIVFGLVFFARQLHGQDIPDLFPEDAPTTVVYRHSIDLCPISPLFDIWAVQYSYRFAPRSDLMLGLAYTNIRYEDIGRSHAPTLIAGYKHFVWKNLHAEYQLWPAYNAFRSYDDGLLYRGFEVWNEARVGYKIDFEVGARPMYLNLQYLYGFGLYPGNKPQAFLDHPERTFHSPIFFVGTRF
jgi:hypothetical protein